MSDTLTRPVKEVQPKEVETKEVEIKEGIQVTEAAVKEFQRLFDEKQLGEEYGLRVGIKGGGCYGFSYLLGFDKKTEQDVQFDFSGLRVFMQKSHGMYLMGMEIDFYNDLSNRGFVFNNPNASTNCGCGNSFSA